MVSLARVPRTDRRRSERQRVVTPEIEEQITERVAEGASVKELSEEFDIGEMPARDARQRAWGRLDERAAAAETATAAPAARQKVTTVAPASVAGAVVSGSPSRGQAIPPMERTSSAHQSNSRS